MQLLELIEGIITVICRTFEQFAIELLCGKVPLIQFSGLVEIPVNLFLRCIQVLRQV